MKMENMRLCMRLGLIFMLYQAAESKMEKMKLPQ